MTSTVRRAAVPVLAGALGAALLASPQTPPPQTSTFRLYVLGREVGREVASQAIDGSIRRLQSTVTYTERGQNREITATLDTTLDGSPRRLLVRGQRVREGRTDLEVTIEAGRARLRDGTATSAVDIGNRMFFPVEGPAPVALQEHLIRYWRNRGRPREIGSAPVGPIRIERRAESQTDLGGRSISLERLAIDGPVWGHETAWVEPGGALVALTTWVGGLPLQAVREGYEARLNRFMEEALGDRLIDADRLARSVAPDHPAGVVLRGATVVVGGGRAPIPDAAVVIRENRIAAVGPSARIKPPADLPVVDVRGMTIVAGLVDLHGQVSHVEWAPVNLAAGITTVRNVSPDPTFTAELRQATIDNYLLGPQLISVGLIDGGGPDSLGPVTVSTDEEGRQAVRRYRSEGVRQLQLGDRLDPAVFRAIGLEANRLGMSVAGGVPIGMTPIEALYAGLNHVDSMPVDVGDPAALALFFSALARRPSPFLPLAAWRELLQRQAEQPIASFQPAIARMPSALARRFADLGSPAAGGPAVLMMLRAARAAGVQLAAGTGPGLPGFGVQRELELFVEAGMPAADALQAVTAAAAQLMKMDDRGTVEAGKRADLVVLSGNPLENISHVRTAKWVVANGKLYDCAKLWQAAGFEKQ